VTHPLFHFCVGCSVADLKNKFTKLGDPKIPDFIIFWSTGRRPCCHSIRPWELRVEPVVHGIVPHQQGLLQHKFSSG